MNWLKARNILVATDRNLSAGIVFDDAEVNSALNWFYWTPFAIVCVFAVGIIIWGCTKEPERQEQFRSQCLELGKVPHYDSLGFGSCVKALTVESES